MSRALQSASEVVLEGRVGAVEANRQCQRSDRVLVPALLDQQVSQVVERPAVFGIEPQRFVVLGQRGFKVARLGERACQGALGRHRSGGERFGHGRVPFRFDGLPELDQDPCQVDPALRVVGLDQDRLQQVRLGEIEVASLPGGDPQHVVAPRVGRLAFDVSDEEVDGLAEASGAKDRQRVVVGDRRCLGERVPRVGCQCCDGRFFEGDGRLRHRWRGGHRDQPGRVVPAFGDVLLPLARRSQCERRDRQPRGDPAQHPLRAILSDSSAFHGGLPACRPGGCLGPVPDAAWSGRSRP